MITTEKNNSMCDAQWPIREKDEIWKKKFLEPTDCIFDSLICATDFLL